MKKTTDYLNKLNYAETDKQLLEIVRNLPIGHFHSLVKCVGILINEFSKASTPKTEKLKKKKYEKK